MKQDFQYTNYDNFFDGLFIIIERNNKISDYV
jgi:hypothetical protein